MGIIRLRDLSAFTVRMAAELSQPAMLEHAAGYDRDTAHLAGMLGTRY